jgi:hypothetical protein
LNRSVFLLFFVFQPVLEYFRIGDWKNIPSFPILDFRKQKEAFMNSDLIEHGWKYIASTALLIASVGLSWQGMQPAQAINGPNLSLGTNPVFSVGGTNPGTIMSADPSQMMVVTDVILTTANTSNNISNPCRSVIELSTSAGKILGSFRLTSIDDNGYAYQPTSIQHPFVSGLPVPVNESLELSHTGDCHLNYTISGHYAAP